METLGDRIRLLRNNNGLTQKDLGLKLSLAKNTISQYETGISEPSKEILDQICSIFGVTYNYLMTGKEDELEKQFPDGVRVLRRGLNELTPQQRDNMINIINEYIESHKKK